MTDPIDLLSRRNPVDEATLQARDARATEDLARIMDEPVASGRPPRRDRSGRGLRLALGGAGIAGIAALMGGLFLLQPGDGPAPPGGALAPGEWALESTVRVEPRPGGEGLDRATARAAEIIRARAAAMRIKDVTAAAAAPGSVRVVIPYTVSRREITALTRPTDVSILDLIARRVADSRNPALAVRWLRGSARPGRPGSDWYALAADGRMLEGPLPARDTTLRGTGIRWVRPQAGVRALKVYPSFLGLPEGEGTYVVVDGAPSVASAAVAAVTRAPGDRLVMRLRRGAVLPKGAVVAHDGWVIGRAVAVPGDPAAVRVLSTGRYAARPGEWATELAGGGLDARLTVEAVRVLGDPPPRTGDRDAVPPQGVRTLLGTGRLAITTGIDPASWLRVLSTGSGDRAWEVWEALTMDGRTVHALKGAAGTGGGEDCLLAPNARVIRACTRSDNAVTGRVAPSVASVEVRGLDGSVTVAAVQNGWFLAAIPEAARARIVALDSSGRVLGATSR